MQTSGSVRTLECIKEQGRTLQNIKTYHFRQLFNQKKLIRDPSKGFRPKKIIFFWTKIWNFDSKNSIFCGCNLRQWKTKVQKWGLQLSLWHWYQIRWYTQQHRSNLNFKTSNPLFLMTLSFKTQHVFLSWHRTDTHAKFQVSQLIKRPPWYPPLTIYTCKRPDQFGHLNV